MSVFLLSGAHSSFSQVTNVEDQNDSSIEKSLEIKGDPTINSVTTYRIIVSGQISLGPNANPHTETISLNGTIVDGEIFPTGLDNFFFTGDIISITADQNVFSFVDGKSFQKLPEEDLKLVEEYLDQAKTFFEQRYTESALFHYDKVLEINPLNIDALNGKANVLDLIGEYYNAISYYEKVLSIAPTNNDALLGITISLDNLGKSEEAIQYLDEDIGSEEIQQPLQNISNESLGAMQEFFEKAQELLEEESFEESILYFDEALAIDSSDIDALNGKAFALASINNHEEAISFYEKTLAIDSSDIDALNGKAFALASINNHEEAISFYENVIEIDSTNIDALYGKALSLDSLGREDESLLYLEKIETLLPPETGFRESNEPLNDDVIEEINEYDQILFIVIGVFIIILVIVILIDLITKRRKLDSFSNTH